MTFQAPKKFDAKALLSDTYIYGCTWDGEPLLLGRLTAGKVFQLAGEEKKHRTKRQRALESRRSRAVGGFELAMQLISTQADVQKSAPLIIEAWANYAAHTKVYAQLNQYRHDQGTHIVLVGWYLKSGKLRIKTEIALNDSQLTAEQIKHVAYCAMEKAYVETPDEMPEGYIPLPSPTNLRKLKES